MKVDRESFGPVAGSNGIRSHPATITNPLSCVKWRRGPGSTVIEISNLTRFLILIVILLLIFKPQEITIMMKIKIKRRKVAKHSLNSMAVHPCPPWGEYVLWRSAELHSAVSQICNLRRIATGQRLGPVRHSAEYNSAIRQIKNIKNLRDEARYRAKLVLGTVGTVTCAENNPKP